MEEVEQKVEMCPACLATYVDDDVCGCFTEELARDTSDGGKIVYRRATLTREGARKLDARLRAVVNRISRVEGKVFPLEEPIKEDG